MNGSVLAGVLAVVLVALLIGGGIGYTNLNSQMASIGNDLRNTEKERDDLTAKLKEKEKELSDVRQRADLGDEELAKERERIQRLHAGIGVIGECLNGVLQSMSASNNGDEARAVLVLLTVVESCKTSQKIIGEVQALQSSSDGAATTQSVAQSGARAAYR